MRLSVCLSVCHMLFVIRNGFFYLVFSMTAVQWSNHVAYLLRFVAHLRFMSTVFLSLKVFNDVLSRAFLSCRERDSSCCGSISPGDGTDGRKQSIEGDQSTNTTPGESLANQRDWSVLMTVLDRLCFTLSVTAVFAAIVIFFPRWLFCCLTVNLFADNSVLLVAVY